MNASCSRTARKRQKRRAERASVLMPASVVTISAYHFPELLNISTLGAKLRGSSLPPQTAIALLRIGPFKMLCRVVWVEQGQCGGRVEEPLPHKVLKQIQMDGGIVVDMLTPAEQVAADAWLEGHVD